METARYMARMFDLSLLPEHVRILDPGIGSGILSAAIIDRLNEIDKVKTIHLTCYETDPEIQPLLLENVALMKQLSDVPVQYEVITDDYILTQHHDFEGSLIANPNPPKYDLIIANPPYVVVPKNNIYAITAEKMIKTA